MYSAYPSGYAPYTNRMQLNKTMDIRKILLSLALAFGMQAVAQTIDTLMVRFHTDGTTDTLSISKIDSITFGYDAIWGCNGVTSLSYNGYSYDLVEIGNQCWFKENLRTTTYRDSTPIDYPGTDNTVWFNNTMGAYAWYDNDSSTNASTYGALYNWHAVDNSAGLCPIGWHVPSDSAWTVLDSFLAHNGYNYDGSTTGNKYAKAMADTVLWNPDTTVGSVGNTDYRPYRNKSGFSGLPGGSRSVQGGNYYAIGTSGLWWSSTQNQTSTYWYRSLAYGFIHVNRGSSPIRIGFSVRCLKD